MSQQEKEKKQWGGARPGAGRPPGRTKKTISVSVNANVLKRAITRWREETSRLVEKLLDLYGSKRVSLEAAAHE
jgi:hypothetical protein